MEIPVIRSKKYLRSRAVAFSVTTIFALSVLIVFSSFLLTVMNYKTLVFVMVFILASQFVFNLVILFTKKYHVLGFLHVNNQELVIDIETKPVTYELNKIKETKFLISGYKNFDLQNKSLINKNEAGNYLIFKYGLNTLVYELLFSSSREAQNFIDIVKANSGDQSAEIIDR